MDLGGLSLNDKQGNKGGAPASAAAGHGAGKAPVSSHSDASFRGLDGFNTARAPMHAGAGMVGQPPSQQQTLGRRMVRFCLAMWYIINAAPSNRTPFWLLSGDNA